MKKLLLLLLCVPLIFSCGENEEKDNDETVQKEEKLCKIITGYTIVDKFGGDYKQLSSQRIYNKYGKKYSDCQLDPFRNSKLKTLCVYTYNEKGNLIEKYRYLEGRAGYFKTRITRTLYVYDQSISHKSYVEFNTYILSTNSSNQLYRKGLIKFNDNGNKIESKEYNDEGKLLWTDLYEYDEYENIIKRITFNPERSITNYQYADGKKMQEIETNGTGHTFTSTYDYDDKDSLVFLSFESSRYPIDNHQDHFEYDDNGEVKKRTRLPSNEIGNREINYHTIIYKTEYCNCEDIENKIYQDPLSNSNPTNNTSNNINTTKSSSSNSYQQKQTETKKSKCYKCNGSGDCRRCTKPQKVRTWSNGWRNNTEVRLGRVVCSTCQGNGRVKESVSGGQYNSGNSCHIGDCISGFRTCRDCSKSNPGKCTKCEGSG